MTEQGGPGLGWWGWLQYAEPARLRAVWVAGVSVLAAVGVTVSTSVDAKVGGFIAAAGLVLSLAHGEWTRAAVYSPQSYQAAEAAAARDMGGDTPG